MKPKVYIIIVNYNGWQDTVECIESVLKSDFGNFQVIVVDNNSQDESMNYLIDWAEGRLNIWTSPHNKLRMLSLPPVEKPVGYEYLNGDSDFLEEADFSSELILIQSAINGGFAAANNIAIKFAYQRGDSDYIWLLNNDTVIERDTLSELVYGIQRHKDAGAAGSKIFFYDDPDRLQSLGSKVDPNNIFKLCKPVVDLKVHGKVIDSYNQDFFVDDIMGASMLIKQAALKKVGMMPEEYFLYGEETDYNFNLKKNGYKLVTIPKSRLYHKKSVSMGGEDSPLALYYRTRNQFILYKKYMSSIKYFMYVFLYTFKKLYLALSGDKQSRKIVVKALLDGWLGRTGMGKF
ncbi:dTDP-Rha:A-D-GlcNAc-diphosphoryl polyprenol, A-3-L-rhamnosyl transferase WbbL [hydrothermal vent metagenome]|uniref:dTDP-Rha:A-D-GlcNAc-diphosphoryl polyprenol, A-3-L-rhamnosyl transferase WbbL n=1 Tax=hydrothermal vent metagenome TaxID=652676 RepID=A0A3B0VRB9_9ZZZZ